MGYAEFCCTANQRAVVNRKGIRSWRTKELRLAGLSPMGDTRDLEPVALGPQHGGNDGDALPSLGERQQGVRRTALEHDIGFDAGDTAGGAAGPLRHSMRQAASDAELCLKLLRGARRLYAPRPPDHPSVGALARESKRGLLGMTPKSWAAQKIRQ